MCGRYFYDLQSERLKNYWNEAKIGKEKKIAANEIFPSNQVITLAVKQKEVVAGVTRWGFEGFRRGQLLINARAETVEEKKTFAKHFKESRCVFPMSGFYEWKEKEKFFFSNNEVLYVACFYRIHKKETGFETESILLTTAANESVERVHDRKNEAIVILNNYFKGGVGKSKLSTMFAYLTDKLNLKVLMIDKDLQATLTKDLAKTFEVELPRVNFYEGLKNGNLTSSIIHLTDNLDLIPGTFDLMLLPKLTRSWTFENESRLLATLLEPLKSDYDLIIIDTVPTPSVYTNNAIVASDYVMIPLQAEEESTNNIQNYISYLIDLQEQFNPGLDMIGFVPYLVDTDSATIKSNLEELYKEHEEDNLVFQNIIKRSNKVSTWSKNGITEHKGYDKKVLSMYENVFFEMVERIIQLENEKE